MDDIESKECDQIKRTCTPEEIELWSRLFANIKAEVKIIVAKLDERIKAENEIRNAS